MEYVLSIKITTALPAFSDKTVSLVRSDQLKWCMPNYEKTLAYEYLLRGSTQTLVP